jgi:hypothetical protein
MPPKPQFALPAVFHNQKLWLYGSFGVIAALIANAARWRLVPWTWSQLAVMPSVLATSPIPHNLGGSADFWFGQALSVALICVGTVLLSVYSKMYEDAMMNYMFRTRLQRVVFKHVLLSSVRGAVFIFLGRQVRLLAPARGWLASSMRRLVA